MSSLTRHLSADLRDVHYSTRVGSIVREGLRWALFDEDGEALGQWSRVVIAVPGPQAEPLLTTVAPAMAQQVATITYDPCWAVMVEFAAGLETSFEGARVKDSPLGWIARDGSKPGRPHGERWVLHASPTWSQTHLEAPREEIADRLMEAFAAVIQSPLPPTTSVVAHRWRYALARQVLDAPCLYDRTLGLAVCGDGCLGGRVEAAWKSGAAAAGRILGHVQRPLANAKPGTLL